MFGSFNSAGRSVLTLFDFSISIFQRLTLSGLCFSLEERRRSFQLAADLLAGIALHVVRFRRAHQGDTEANSIFVTPVRQRNQPNAPIGQGTGLSALDSFRAVLRSCVCPDLSTLCRSFMQELQSSPNPFPQGRDAVTFADREGLELWADRSR